MDKKTVGWNMQNRITYRITLVGAGFTAANAFGPLAAGKPLSLGTQTGPGAYTVLFNVYWTCTGSSTARSNSQQVPQKQQGMARTRRT